MFFAVKSGPTPLSLSAYSHRKDDQASPSLLRSRVPRPLSPAAWALRTGRRVRMLCLTALVTIYIVYYLDVYITAPAVLNSSHGVALGSTASADSPQVISNSTTKPKPLAAVDDAIKKAEAELTAMDKATFIHDISSTDIRGIYDGQSMYDLCSSKDIKWQSSIIFDCGALEGGYGTVRNAALTCLRLTIEAGGSLLMPRISRRNPKNIADFRTNDMVPFSYLFDEAHFKSTLATYCPRLTIHDSLEQLKQHPGVSRNALTLDPHEPRIITTRDGHLIDNPSELRKSFHAWVNKANKGAQFPVRVSLTPKVPWRWPTSHDPPSFVRSFSSVIRPSRPSRLAAAEALYNLVNEHVPPSRVAGKAPTDFTLPFIGIHLRAEKDLPAKQPKEQKHHVTDYPFQADYYLARLEYDLLPSFFPSSSSSSSSPQQQQPPDHYDVNKVPVYVASGDPEQVKRFAEELAYLSPSIEVVTKSTLVPAETLSRLTWDQQGLVDFQVMERASHVMGIRESSFAWTLALKRAAAANWVVGGFPEGPCWVDDDDDDDDDDDYDDDDEGQRDMMGGGTGRRRTGDKGGRRGGTGGAGADGNGGKGKGKRGKRRGCKKDLEPHEYWRDELSALVGGLGEAAGESVDVVRSSIWP